jgi:glycosyltransferase involved in cell wall biosynthesis
VLPSILQQLTAFLVIGDRIHDFYASFGARSEQIFRMPIMLDEGFWTLAARKPQVRAQTRSALGLEDEFTVLCVGKLIPRKRPQDLLDALEIIACKPGATKRRFRLLFAGDGEMRAELQAKAARSSLPATFLGFVNIDQLPAYYCAADVLAHPAENESYGMIALEAAVLGLPLVLSDTVGAIGPTSIGRPGHNAAVYRTGDVEALATALRTLANDPELCSSMSEASLALAEEHRGPVSVHNTIAAVRYCLSKSGRTRIGLTSNAPQRADLA